METKYKVGDETNFFVNGSRGKVEQVVLWDDGYLRCVNCKAVWTKNGEALKNKPV